MLPNRLSNESPVFWLLTIDWRHPVNILVLGVAFSDIKGFPFGKYDPVGTNKGAVTITHGGVARNVAEDLAVLGANVAFPLMTDDTPLGKDIRQGLERAGVDLSDAVQVERDGAGMWLAVFNDQGELAGSVSQMPDVKPLENLLDEKGDRLFSACDAVVVEFDTSEYIARQACELARKHDKPLYAIVGNMSVILACPELMACTRAAIMNEIEAGKLFGCDLIGQGDEEILEHIREAGEKLALRSAIVTRGPRGCAWADFESGLSGCMTPVECKVVDTTGAGDAFFSAAVMALTLGDSIPAACEKGTLLAGRVVQTARSACPPDCRSMFTPQHP